MFIQLSSGPFDPRSCLQNLKNAVKDVRVGDALLQEGGQ